MPGGASSGDAAGLETAAIPRDASSGAAAGIGIAAVPRDASSGDAAGFGTAAAPGDASSGEAAGVGGATVPRVAPICGRALVREMSLLPVLPLLISFGTGDSSKSLPVDSTLDAACKAA